MILKFTMMIFGNNFRPDKALPTIVGEHLLLDKNNPGDYKFDNREDKYEFGSITVWHPKRFCIYGSNAKKYEEWFVTFLEENHNAFVGNGADTYHLFMEVYYEGDQCNFEIMEADLLKRITQFDVSLPISIYKLTKQYYNKWQKEIELIWRESSAT